MEWKRKLRADSTLRLFSTGVITALIGFTTIALIGWKLNMFPDSGMVTRLLSMEPSTAFCFLFSGVAFLLLKKRSSGEFRKRTGWLLSTGILIISLAGMWRAFDAADIYLKENIFAHSAFGISARDILGLNFITAFGFLFISLSLFTLHLHLRNRYMPAQFMALHSLFAGSLAALGVLYNVRTLSGKGTFNVMSLHGAGCFIVFSVAVLLLYPRKGLMKALSGRTSGSVLARTVIPYAIVVPAILGYIRLYGQYRNFYGMETGVVFLVITIIILFSGLLWVSAVELNKKDIARMASEQALIDSEHRIKLLVSKVADYAIFMLNPEGIVLNWNEGASAISGYREEEIVGRSMSLFYTENKIKEGEPTRNLQMALSEGHFEEESWRMKKDGERFWANNVLTPVYKENNVLEGFVNITRNINRRKSDQEQIAYLARMIEDISDSVISVDLSFVIRSWNKAAEALYGYEASEAIGRSMRSVFKITTAEAKQELIRGELRNRGYFKGEVNHTARNGEELTILISIAQTKTARGTPDGFVMVCRDISDRKKMEENLQRFNEQLTSEVKIKTIQYTDMLERVTDAFFATDADLRLIYINGKAAQIGRTNAGMILGKNMWTFTPELLSVKTCQAFAEAMHDQEYNCVSAFIESLQLFVEYHIYPAPEGLSVFIRDVTERKKAEEALLYSEATRKLIIHSALDAIVCFDLSGKITIFNSRAEACFGWKEAELKGTCIDQVIKPVDYETDFRWPEYLLSEASRVVKEGILEAIAIKKTGGAFPIELTVVQIHQQGEDFYCAFVRDISVRKEAEEKLNRSFEEIRELASHLQHIREEERADIAREIHDELGQQLTAVKMDMAWAHKKAEAVTGSEELRLKLKGAIGLINSSIQSVRKIATDLHPSILDDLGLMAAIEWYSQEFENRSGISARFTSSLSDDKFAPEVAIALFRICQESLTNVSRHAAAKQVQIQLVLADELVLTISDDGQGFDPLARRQRRSLGLVGMKERAQMLGGSYEISSRVGHGTLIEVRIPLSALKKADGRDLTSSGVAAPAARRE